MNNTASRALRTLFLAAFFGIFCTLAAFGADDERTFHINIYNKEYKVFIILNAYEQTVVVPGQEVFGEMPGYFGSDDDGRCWLITDAVISSDSTKVSLAITNDYGSEDLEAELTVNKDGTYTLKQLEGSPLKIARNRKWVKIPKTLVFERRRM